MSKKRIPDGFRRACLTALLALAASTTFGQEVQPSGSTSAQPAVVPAPAPVSPETQQLEAPVTPGPAPGRRAVEPREPLGAVQPYQVGSFLLYPEVVATRMYDDNVFSTQSGTLSDSAWIVSPRIWAQSNWARHFVAFSASADFSRYNRYTTENSDDYRVSGEGRYDISTEANVYGGLKFAREHEDRESPDFRNGIYPTQYTAQRGYAGAFRQLGRWSLRAGANVLRLNFSSVPFVNGEGGTEIINNSDRDRTQTGAGIRVGYELTRQVEGFVQLAADTRRYWYRPDDLGFDRDSNGVRADVGVRAFSPGVYKVEAYVGHMRQNYSDPALADVSVPGFGGNLVWQATKSSTLSFYLDRTIEETTVFSGTVPNVVPASSYLNTYGQLTLDHRFTARTSAYAFGSQSRVDYRGLERIDDYYGAGIGVVHRLAKSVFLDASYQHRRLDSAVPTEDFRRNLVFLRLSFPLQP